MDMDSMLMNSKAKFLRYQQGVAYFVLTIPYSEMLYSFPVPVNESNEELLEAEGKTIQFMPHISRAIQQGTLRKVAYT